MDWSAEMFICSLSILDFTMMNQLVSTQPFYFICYVTKPAFNPWWAGLIASWIRILKCYRIKYLHQTWLRMLKVSEGKPFSLSVLPHFPIVSLDKPLVCVCVCPCPCLCLSMWVEITQVWADLCPKQFQISKVAGIFWRSLLTPLLPSVGDPHSPLPPPTGRSEVR